MDADIQDIKSDANGFHIKSLSYQRSKVPVFTVEVTVNPGLKGSNGDEDVIVMVL